MMKSWILDIGSISSVLKLVYKRAFLFKMLYLKHAMNVWISDKRKKGFQLT